MASIYKTDVMELKKLMVENNINSIVELSEKTGINRNTLSSVLNGSCQPASNTMDKLVDSLCISPEKAGSIFFSQYLHTA